jgi:hypothetical protein
VTDAEPADDRTTWGLPSLTWVQRSLLVGGALAAAWSLWFPVGVGLTGRMLWDVLLFLVVPGLLALGHDRSLGWRVDRRAVRDAALLAAFVVPFYVVGSALPSVRAFYPMWGMDSTALSEFLPHAVQQFVVVLAAETYYRGLLCVGVRELGPKAAFISPVVYFLHHAGKPPVEQLLSAPTDVLFGLVDYHADSILPSVVAHGLGLILLDWLVLHEPVVPTEVVLGLLRWLPIPL